jgi:hypothetical protein
MAKLEERLGAATSEFGAFLLGVLFFGTLNGDHRNSQTHTPPATPKKQARNQDFCRCFPRTVLWLKKGKDAFGWAAPAPAPVQRELNCGARTS